MSDFSQLLTATADESLLLLHGDSGRFSYTPPGGDPVACDAIAGPEEAELSTESPGELVAYKRSVLVRVADLASPHETGTATIDDVDYTITAVARSSGGMWELSLRRAAAVSITRDHYRRTS